MRYNHNYGLQGSGRQGLGSHWTLGINTTPCQGLLPWEV